MIGEDGQIIINEQSLTVQNDSPSKNIVYEDVVSFTSLFGALCKVYPELAKL